MSCTSKKYVGREATIEFVVSCGDVMPAEDDWMLIGAVRSISQTFTWDTVDATADDVKDAIRENLATWLNYEISADGVNRRSDDETSNQVALRKHFINPVETGGQPIIMVRVTDPAVTTIATMLMSEMSLDYPNDDVATWSLSASVTGSTIGLQVTDTPVGPDPAGG